MRLLLSLLVLVLVSAVGCTAEFPTTDIASEDVVSNDAVFAKSDHAAGVIRHDDQFFMWFYDAETGIEYDFFDPAALCNDGFEASRVTMSVQELIKEDLTDDPDNPDNDRIHRIVKGEDIPVFVSHTYWPTCEAWFDSYDQGLVDVGTADVRMADNDLNGWRDRQNANAWKWSIHGKTVNAAGDTRILNITRQCLWVDVTGDASCHSNFRYN